MHSSNRDGETVTHRVFEGLAVLEVSVGSMASSIVGMLMADHGARVLKVEPPGGDWLRRMSPSGFRVWNRGKESIELDLASPAGQEHLRVLAERADVVVEALRPGRAERFGLVCRSNGGQNPRGQGERHCGPGDSSGPRSGAADCLFR